MNILVLTWRDMKHPQSGGSELYFHELAKVWAKEGHNVTWIGGGWKGCKKSERYDKINFIRAGETPLSLYFLAPLAYTKLKEKPDVIIDNENGIPFFSPFFSRSRKILHIHHVHKDVWFQGDVGKLTGILGYMIESYVMPRVYKNCPIITISKGSADEIVKEKFTKHYPAIVNPGVDFFEFKKVPKSKKPSILFLNRVKKYKGIHTLIDAVKELKKQGFSNFDAWIAGSGEDLERMKKYASANKLENITFFGRVDEEKKKELMQKAWIFMNPSFKEGWGIVNVEANYFGTPVIGSNVSGIKDSVVDGKTGVLFQHGNPIDLAAKIKELLTDKAQLAKMGAEGIKWARKFSWESKAKEYLKILKSVSGKN